MSHIGRMEFERVELRGRLNALSMFMLTEQFKGLEAAEQDRMQRQSRHMAAYLGVLCERLDAAQGVA